MSNEWIDIGPAAGLTETSTLSGEVDGYPVVVARCGERLFAVEDRCSHDGESLAGAEIEKCEIICPRHGARFDLRTGDALTPPAYEPIKAFNVREHGGRILVASPS